MTRRLSRCGIAGLALALVAGVSSCGVVPGGSQPEPGSVTSTDGAPPQPSPSTPTESTPTPTPTPDPIVMTPSVKDGATDVKVDTVVSVKAAAGTLSKVSLSYKTKDSAGKSTTVSVDGTLNDDKTDWTASGGLDPDVKYQLSMTGTATSNGEESSSTSTFTTQALTLDEQTYPTLFPGRGSTVGVGMPVILTFDLPVKDKAEFEKHLKVTSSPKQEGTWHWVSDTEVHYRPKDYWQPGTKVTVNANLNGVAAGNGIYGQHSRTTSFTIGKSVITKVNLKTKKAKVYINGKLARTILISAGKPGFTTRSGTKLIMAKLRHTRMASETIGIGKNSPEYYDLDDVEYAMRITASGEFLHAAPWNAGKFGQVNSSHGCVGMSTADARWLFNTVSIGDPVITTGSDRGLEQGNGWSDWDVSYKKYAKGSAL